MLTPFNNWESSSTYRPSQKPRTLIVSTLNAYKAPWMRCVMLRVKPNKKNLKLLVDWQTYYSSSSNHYNLPYKNPSKPSMNWNMQVKFVELQAPEGSVRLRWEDNYHFQAQLGNWIYTGTATFVKELKYAKILWLLM